MNPNIGLSDKNRTGVIKILQAHLADNLLLEIKTRNAHWNVTGPHFNHLHLFFESQYEALAEGTDEIAERIRALGGKAIGTMTEALKLSRLKETPGQHPDSRGWLQALLSDHEAVIRQLRTDADIVDDDYKDTATNDFLVGLIEEHEKTAWMLRASLE